MVIIKTFIYKMVHEFSFSRTPHNEQNRWFLSISIALLPYLSVSMAYLIEQSRNLDKCIRNPIGNNINQKDVQKRMF